ncbi:MAG: alpha/beta hydrolase [Fibrobacterales bacterium]
MKQSIEFYSDSHLLKGTLYTPNDVNPESPLPLILLCHGFAGVKELLLPNFAERFAKNGFAAVTFDYRGFGESEGTRSRIIPQEQISDIRNALTYLETRPEINEKRMGVWGTSLGGAHSLVAAATDTRIKSVAVQITFGDGMRNNTGHMDAPAIEKLNASLNKAWNAEVTKNKVMGLPLKRVLSDEQSKQFYVDYAEDFPEALGVKVPFTTTRYINEYSPESYFSTLTAPTLVIGATNDIVNKPSESEEIFNKLQVDEKKLIMQDATHYDIYVGNNFESVSTAQLEWFQKYL